MAGKLVVNWTVICGEHNSLLVAMPDGSVRCPCQIVTPTGVVVCQTHCTKEETLTAIGESVAQLLAAAGYEVRKKVPEVAKPPERKDWS